MDASTAKNLIARPWIADVDADKDKVSVPTKSGALEDLVYEQKRIPPFGQAEVALISREPLVDSFLFFPG